MKNILKLNILLFEIVPILFYIILFLILFIEYKAWIAVLIIIPLIEQIIILIKNAKNFKTVQEKINNIGTIIYNDGYAILTNTSILSIKKYFFSIDYKDIIYLYTKKRMFINNRANSLCMITKNQEKYELIFINWLNPFSSRNKQIKEIINIIKSHNFDVNVLK